jgi:hypothetical protein
MTFGKGVAKNSSSAFQCQFTEEIFAFSKQVANNYSSPFQCVFKESVAFDKQVLKN